MSDDDTLVRSIRNEDGTYTTSSPDGSTRTDGGFADWERPRSMTDDEIWENAVSDPDNPPLTPEELERLAKPNDFRDLRLRLNLSAVQFAERFGIPVETVLGWETGQTQPDDGALVLLRVIEHDPEAVIRVVHSSAAD